MSNVLHLSQNQLAQAIGALRAVGLVTDDVLRDKHLTLLGPKVSYVPGEAVLRVSSKSEPHPGGDESLQDYKGPQATHTSGIPYPCWNCKKLNRPVHEKHWYAVTCGLEVGVFYGWDTVQHFINHEGEPGNMIPHAHAECFRTKEKAEQRFAEALAAGGVMKLDL